MTDQPGVTRVLRDRDSARQFYDRISAVYDLLASRSEGPIRRRALQMLELRQGERALEIGCGTGHGLVEMARGVGIEGIVWGLDLSRGMLRRSRRRLRRRGLNGRVPLVCGDATRLPCADDSIDAIFLGFTLELFDTPEIPVVLAECRRVLRPGGRIAVAGVSKLDSDDRRVRGYEWVHRHFPTLVDCRPIFVRRAVAAAGLRIERSTTERMWIPVELVLARCPRATAGS